MNSEVLGDPRRVNPHQSHLNDDFEYGTFDAKPRRMPRKQIDIEDLLETARNRSLWQFFKDNDHILFMRPHQ